MATLADTDVGSILDSIPHEPAREREDKDNGENTPDDPRLDEGKEEVPCRVKCECT